MPSHDRPRRGPSPRELRTDGSAEHLRELGITDRDLVPEAATPAADLSGPAPVTPARVDAAASAMGNAEARAMVDEWVRTQHGGPQNPDDPDDLWYWQHRTTADWDFAEEAALSRKGGGEQEIAGGTARHDWDVGTRVGHQVTRGERRTTTDAHARGGYEREFTDAAGVEHQDRFGAENAVRRVRTRDRSGRLTRTTDVDGSATADLTERTVDGATTTRTSARHGVEWAYDEARSGQREAGSGSIFAGDTYDTLESRSLSGRYDGDFASTATTKVDGGKDVEARKLKIDLAGARKTDGGETTSEIGGTVAGERRIASTRTLDDGTESTRSRTVYGEVGGKRTAGERGAKGWAKARVGLKGEQEHVAVRSDGTRVTTTVSGDGSIHGRVNQDTRGRRTLRGGADVEVGAAWKWEREREDGARIVDEVGVTGSVGGDVKKVGDKDAVPSGTAGLEVQAGRTVRRTREDGARTTTKIRGKATADGTLSADGKHTGDVDAALSASHQVKRATADGSVTDKVYGKVDAGVGAKKYKAGYRRTVDGDVEIGASRKRVREAADGEVTTEVGGRVFGGVKDQEVADGVKRTYDAGAALEASRTRSRKTATGTADTTVSGSATGKRTVTAAPDGRTAVVDDGRLRGDWEHTTRDETRTGVVTSTVGLGGEVRGKRGTNAEGEAIRGVGGTVEVRGRRSRTVEGEDGAKTVTTYTGSGSLGGDVERVGERTTATGTGKVALGAEQVRTYRDGDVDVSRKRTAEFTGSGDLGSDRTGGLKGTVGLGGEETRAWEADGRRIETTVGQKASVGGAVERTADGWRNSQNASLESSRRRKESWTDAAGVAHQTDTGLAGKAGISRSDADKRLTAGMTWDGTHTTVAEGADGAKVTRTVGNTVDVEADVGRKKGAKERDAGIGADWKRTDTTRTERSIEGGKVVDTRGSTSKIGAGYRTDAGPRLEVGQTWTTGTETRMDDGSSRKRDTSLSLTGSADRKERKVGIARTTGETTRRVSDDGKTTTESSRKTTASAGLSSKDGLTAGIEHTRVRERETTRLSDTTTLTTTRGETTAEARSGVNRDKDGNLVASASAKASATAFSKNLAYDDGDGFKAQAGYELGKGEADAKGTATFGKDGVKVKGNAGAKVTLVGGHARAEVPAFTWKLLGEPVRVKITAGINAAVLAEANGEIELDVSKGENLGVTVGGGGRAFAGAKAGVEVGAHVQWLRHGDYSQLLMDFLDDVPGVGRFVDDVPVDLWKQISAVLVGTGTSDLLIAKAGVFGSAGIGGEASFGLSLQGGRVRLQGDLNGAIGLGGGAKTSLDLDAVDGIRFGGVVALRGIEWIKDQIASAASWMNQVIDECRKRIDAYMESKKEEGGFSGMVASAVDWLGDDLFDLW